ncbi:MAG TPA: thioredoxin TrxA [Alphaproteobacteria bacterium]|nr:thioredoxin TrxA [Alphaproteobacteria bacterium]
MSAAKPVTDAGFENDVLKAPGPVLVDFWAEWCGPCKMVGPILDEIAGEMQGQLTIVKMNVDENPMTPSKFGIRGIPTLMLFKGGQLAAQKVGALPKPALQAWLKEQVSG